MSSIQPEAKEVCLSVAIMAIPERMDNVAKMLTKLDSKGGRRIPTVVDRHHDGIWQNARRAWLDYEPRATHHLVLQDDLLLCDELLDGVEQALCHVPLGDFVSLFSQSKRAKDIYDTGKTSWIKAKDFGGVALVLPTEAIDKAIRWSDRCLKPDLDKDDVRLFMWMQRADRWCWITSPSLVEHIGTGNSTRKGVSRTKIIRDSRGTFIGENECATCIDWSRGAKDPPTIVSPMPSGHWAYPGAEKEPAV